MPNKKISDLTEYTNGFDGSELFVLQSGETPAYKVEYSVLAKSSSLFHTHSFSQIENAPTTLAGYGITDAIGTTKYNTDSSSILSLIDGKLSTSSYQIDSSSFLTQINDKISTTQYQTDSSSILSLIDGKLSTSSYQVDSASFLELIAEGGGGGEPVIDLIYDDLYTHIFLNTLVPGQKYKITDFRLMWWSAFTHAQGSVKSSSVIEPLIVTATTTSSLSPVALSCLNQFDLVYYDATASYSKGWGTKTTSIPDFKGWIYRRIDTKRNVDIAWDWRYITNTCVKYNISSIPVWSSATTYAEYTTTTSSNTFVQLNNKIYYSVSGSGTNLNKNPTGSTAWWRPVSDYIEANTYFATNDVVFLDFDIEFFPPALVVDTIEQPTFVDTNFTSSGQSTSERTDTFLHDVYIQGGFNNVIYLPSASQEANGFNKNIIGANFEYNTIRNACLGNKIGDRFISNIIGGDFKNNTIDGLFDYNSVHQAFSANTIGYGFRTNTIYTSFLDNLFAPNIESNVITENFQENVIGSTFDDNVIKNGFKGNIVGSRFTSNNCMKTVEHNTFGSLIAGNTFITNFRYNDVMSLFSNQNFTGGTHVTGSYNTTCFKNSAGTNKLSYYNSSDILTVVAPNT